MKLMEQYTERLNLFLSPETFKAIEQAATIEGRKTGNFARLILNQWAMSRKEKLNGRREKNMGH